MDHSLGLPSDADVDVVLALSRAYTQVTAQAATIPASAAPVHPALGRVEASPSVSADPLVLYNAQPEALFELLCGVLRDVRDAAALYGSLRSSGSPLPAKLAEEAVADPAAFFRSREPQVVDLWCRAHAAAKELGPLCERAISLASAPQNKSSADPALVAAADAALPALLRFRAAATSTAAWADATLDVMGISMRRETHGESGSTTNAARAASDGPHTRIVHDVSHLFNRLRHRAMPFLVPDFANAPRADQDDDHTSVVETLLYYDVRLGRHVLLAHALQPCRALIAHINTEIEGLRQLLRLLAVPSLATVPPHLAVDAASAPAVVKELQARAASAAVELEASPVLYPRICAFEQLRNTLQLQLALSEAEDHEVTNAHVRELLERYAAGYKSCRQKFFDLVGVSNRDDVAAAVPLPTPTPNSGSNAEVTTPGGRGRPVGFRTVKYDDDDEEQRLSDRGEGRRENNSNTTSPVLRSGAGVEMPPPPPPPPVSLAAGEPAIRHPAEVSAAASRAASWRSLIEDFERLRSDVQRLQKALWKDIVTRRIAITENSSLCRNGATKVVAEVATLQEPSAESPALTAGSGFFGGFMCCRAEAPPSAAPQHRRPRRLSDSDAYLSKKLEQQQRVDKLWERVEALAAALEAQPAELTGGYARDWSAKARAVAASFLNHLEGITVVFGPSKQSPSRAGL